eukprot:Gb_34773 [translate_table: standard]
MGSSEEVVLLGSSVGTQEKYMIFDQNSPCPCPFRIMSFHPHENFGISGFRNDNFDGVEHMIRAEFQLYGGLDTLNRNGESSDSLRQAANVISDKKMKKKCTGEFCLPQEEEVYSSFESLSCSILSPENVLADAESCNNCCSDMEDSDEIDALLSSSGDEFISTADSVDDSENNNKIERIRKTFLRLKSMVGADWMDTEAVFDEAIRHIKALQQTQLSHDDMSSIFCG